MREGLVARGRGVETEAATAEITSMAADTSSATAAQSGWSRWSTPCPTVWPSGMSRSAAWTQAEAST